jgi:hypothetical protein
MQIFFVPSKLFTPVFKRALLCVVELEAKNQAFSLKREPLFDTVIQNMVLGQLISLRKKARIMVPDSCVLIGVAD